MISEKVNDILSLLVATILADKRVFAQEIETFMRVAKKLQSIRVAGTSLSEAKLLAWFESNNGIIRNKVTSPEFETWFYGCLRRLDHIEDKDLVTQIMIDIAKSDEEFHVSEKALVVLTANHWNLDVAV